MALRLSQWSAIYKRVFGPAMSVDAGAVFSECTKFTVWIGVEVASTPINTVKRRGVAEAATHALETNHRALQRLFPATPRSFTGSSTVITSFINLDGMLYDPYGPTLTQWPPIFSAFQALRLMREALALFARAGAWIAAY